MAAKHNSSLDGVRGIAVLLVLLSHGVVLINRSHPLLDPVVKVLSFGWCGVDLFFVLSGFLITGILLKTKSAENRITSFYMRRFLRIFPLYYLVLSVIFAAAMMSPWLRSVLPFSRKLDHVAFVLFLQNWLPFRHGGQFPANIIGHFWSLAVEEQFYLIWPWIVWAISKRKLVWICFVGAACPLLLRIALVHFVGPKIWIFILTPTRGEGLLIGSALALLVSLGGIPRQLLVWMALGGFGLLLPILLASATPWVYVMTFGFSGFSLLSGALVGSCTYLVPFLTAGLRTGWLRSFGRYSYGIYVYHVPILMVTVHLIFERFHEFNRLSYELPALVGFAAVSYGIAWLSYNFYEDRFLRLKDRFEPSRMSEALQPAPIGQEARA